MDKIDLTNPVLAVAMLSQKIAELERDTVAGKAELSEDAKKELSEAGKAELSECLQQRGGLLMAMGDKQGAEADMKRYLELNPEKVGELSGEFKAEGREHCR